MNEYFASFLHSSQAAAIAAKKNAKQLPVRGRAPGALELYQEKRWRQLERVAQELRFLGDQPLSQPRADSLAKRFGVDRSTIYRYRSRLREVDETTAKAGRTRGWKPLASRLSAKQEEGIEEALNSFRKKAGPIRLIDLVDVCRPISRHSQTIRSESQLFRSSTARVRRWRSSRTTLAFASAMRWLLREVPLILQSRGIRPDRGDGLSLG